MKFLAVLFTLCTLFSSSLLAVENSDYSEIKFKDNWEIAQTAPVIAGQKLVINYDIDRLPNCRSSYMGVPTWSIFAFVRFDVDEKIVNSFFVSDLHTLEIDVPEGATTMDVWFQNTGRGCSVYYDSNYGENFHFDIMSN